MELLGWGAVMVRPDPTAYIEWSDTGCPDGMLPACLACPLPRCRYDAGGMNARALAVAARHEEVRARTAAGATINEVAAAMGLSRRTVFHALEGWSR